MAPDHGFRDDPIVAGTVEMYAGERYLVELRASAAGTQGCCSLARGCAQAGSRGAERRGDVSGARAPAVRAWEYSASFGVFPPKTIDHGRTR